MKEEQIKIHSGKSLEASENKELPPAQESPEEMRGNIIVASEKAVTSFIGDKEGNMEMMQGRADEDALVIDASDKSELDQLNRQADEAKKILQDTLNEDIFPDKEPVQESAESDKESFDPELFNMNNLPLNELQKKMLQGEKLSLSEMIRSGRDAILTGEIAPGIVIKPDCAYRAMDQKTLMHYIKTGGVEVDKHGDVYDPDGGNKGVDWYLGGFAPKYGSIIVETPARKKKFNLVRRDESLLGKHPLVVHIKSEGGENAVSMEDISMILKIKRSDSGKIDSFEKLTIDQIKLIADGDDVAEAKS